VRKDPKAAPEAFKTLEKTLKPAQRKRLKEISYQVRGGAAVGDSDVAKVLGLSAKQKTDIREIWVDEEKNLQMLLKVTRFRTPTVRQAYISKHRRSAGEKMLGVLTPDQQKKFAGLLGEKFDITELDTE
jgi:hypothetical protein